VPDSSHVKEVRIRRQWRTALLSDDILLRQLPFKEPPMSSPFIRKIGAGAAFPATTGLPITPLIHRVRYPFPQPPQNCNNITCFVSIFCNPL